MVETSALALLTTDVKDVLNCRDGRMRGSLGVGFDRKTTEEESEASSNSSDSEESYDYDTFVNSTSNFGKNGKCTKDKVNTDLIATTGKYRSKKNLLLSEGKVDRLCWLENTEISVGPALHSRNKIPTNDGLIGNFSESSNSGNER